MTPAARISAVLDLLSEIEVQAPRPADQTVSLYFKNRRYIGAADRRAVTSSVWRILRHRARIDWWLEHLDHPKDARARVLADLALQRTEEIPGLFDGPHSATPPGREERRMMAFLHGHEIFHGQMPPWVRGEFPLWLTPRLEEAWGEDLPRHVGAMRDEAPLDLRVNTLKGTREDAIAALRAEGIDARPCALSPLGLRLASRVALVQVQAWRNGLVEVQDEGSQLVALLTGARPGQAVVDYCAGAGGKTLALAATMENKGRLLACDVAEWRMNKAADRFRRNGVHNVTRRVLSGESDKWIKRAAGTFDRVLVDAPCSGTGTWRRNPDAKWHLVENDLHELVERQHAILASAARLVKPGGRLVYATCSVLLEENERQVERFLAENASFQTVPLGEVWKENLPGDPPGEGPWMRLTPLTHGTDGFFAAVMECPLR